MISDEALQVSALGVLKIMGVTIKLDGLVIMILGLLLLGFDFYVIINLSKYKIGKYFICYLTLVSLATIMSSIPDYAVANFNVIIKILIITSNIFLFITVGQLLLVNTGKLYLILKNTLIVVTIMQTVIIIINRFYNSIYVIMLETDTLIINYIFTIIIFFVWVASFYRKSTTYTKSQIKLLLIGLLVGLVIFLLSLLLPMFMIVKLPIPEVTEIVINNTHIAKNMGVIESNRDMFFISVFSGAATMIVYMLIRRKYPMVGMNSGLFRLLGYLMYLLTFNILLFLCATTSLSNYYILNAYAILAVFALYIFRKNDSSSYKNNLLEILEDERQRVSIYLHDEVLQTLIAATHITEEKPEIHLPLMNLVSDVRQLSQDLFPTMLEDLGVNQSLQILINDIRNDYNIKISYEFQASVGAFPKVTSMVIYRSVRELLMNALKHSKATHIAITVHENGKQIKIQVRDNGIGFVMPENHVLLRSPHMGLYTLKTQVVAIDGLLRLESTPKSGSQIEITIPIE